MDSLQTYRDARNRIFATTTPPAVPAITLVAELLLFWPSAVGLFLSRSRMTFCIAFCDGFSRLRATVHRDFATASSFGHFLPPFPILKDEIVRADLLLAQDQCWPTDHALALSRSRSSPSRFHRALPSDPRPHRAVRACGFYYDYFQGTMANPMIASCSNRETARRAIFLMGFTDDMAGWVKGKR